MSDITMCDNASCPIKEKCFRYTAKPSKYQAYFAENPYKDGICDYFWGMDDNIDELNKIWED